MKLNKQKLCVAMARSCVISKDLQQKSGLPKATYIRALTGKNVRPATIGKIAKALGVPVENLIDMEGD